MSIVSNPAPTPALEFVRAADDHLDAVLVALHVWYNRIGTAPNGSAHRAVEDIDQAIRALHHARDIIVREVRRYEDETAERVDALLATIRAERGDR